MSQQEATLTKKQKLLSRIVLGAAIILLGVFLLLCGLDVIKVRIIRVILPAALIAVGLVCFVWAFIQDNSLTLWLAFPLFFSAMVSILVLCTDYGYGVYYPLYILSVAAASLVTAIYNGQWRDHTKIIIIFGISAIIFALNSILNITWAVVLPVFILFFGVSVTAYSILRRNE